MAESGAVRDYYDAWTARYVAAFGECIQAHRPTSEDALLEYLTTRAGLRDGQTVLDAGCGICGPARYFARHRDITIEALTLSPVQADIARARNRAEGLDGRVRVTIGDFHRLAELYGRERFDVAVYLESLSHSPCPGEALRSAYEALKPGGIVYVKDYFIRRCEAEAEQRRVLEVVGRVDRLFATTTAWASDIQQAFRETGFLLRFASHPQFVVDNGRWQQFERRHGIDLFGGGESFNWSEWWEMRYQKP